MLVVLGIPNVESATKQRSRSIKKQTKTAVKRINIPEQTKSGTITLNIDNTLYNNQGYMNVGLGYSWINNWNIGLSLVGIPLYGVNGDNGYVTNNIFDGNFLFNLSKMIILGNRTQLVFGSQIGATLITPTSGIELLGYGDLIYKVFDKVFIDGGIQVANDQMTGFGNYVGPLIGLRISPTEYISLSSSYAGRFNGFNISADIDFTKNVSFNIGTILPGSNQQFGGIMGISLQF